MKRLAAIAVAAVFAMQAIVVAGACRCDMGDDTTEMAADHSCCARAAKLAESADDSPLLPSSDAASCCCDIDAFAAAAAPVVSVVEGATSVVAITFAPVAGPLTRTAHAATPIRGPPPIWPPPATSVRLANLQSWLC